MKITDFIEGKVTYDNYGKYFWVNDASEGQHMLAELRGWGRIQNMFQSKGKYDLEGAEKFQDELGEWVASAINEKLEREKEQNLLNKPAVIKSCENCKFDAECRHKQVMPLGYHYCKFYIEHVL